MSKSEKELVEEPGNIEGNSDDNDRIHQELAGHVGEQGVTVDNREVPLRGHGHCREGRPGQG